MNPPPSDHPVADHRSSGSPELSRTGGLPAWAIGPMFLALAAWLVFLSPAAEVPVGEVRLVDRSLFAPGPRRVPMPDPPRAVVGGYEHECMECHRLFDSPPIERRRLTQHTHINLDHGMNNRCFNCHDREDRGKLTLQTGTLIGFAEAPRLCSQCHGTVFRDWQKGTHGKTMGSWDASSGQQHRLACQECHDPHHPAYQRLEPLPGPRTLRMGDQSAPVEHGERHMPLRRWSMPEHDAGTPEVPHSSQEHP